MTFTDDDLKWLKDWLGYCESKFNGQRLDEFHYEAHYHNVKSLLARLEAAEKLIERGALWHDGDCVTANGGFQEHCDCGSYVAEEAWRKAAGK